MIPALGRPFDLGMLYDRRSEKLIFAKTLWSPDHLNKSVKTVPKPYTSSDIITEDTIKDKTSALKVEGGLQLSLIGGLFNVEGAAKYLNDRKESSHQSRVVLKYETTTHFKELTMEHLGEGMMQYPEILDQDIATDVVVGIMYGAKAFMVFDKVVSRDEDLEEVHGNMKVLVNALPSISVDGKGSVNITEDQKRKSENMQCKMYADFRIKENPTNYEDAVRVYKLLPSMIGTNGERAVPIDVYLCPLSEIDTEGQKMVREINAKFVRETSKVHEDLQLIEAKCNDMMKNDVCSHFPRVKKQISCFGSKINEYKTVFQQKLLLLLPTIRGGEAEESELGKILQDKERSPFAQSRIEAWIKEKEKEMKRLQGFTNNLKETPVVSPEDVDIAVCNTDYEQVVCCTFKIASEEDAQIFNMNEYLTGHDVEGMNSNTSLGMNNNTINTKIRDTQRQFGILKAANEDNKTVKFLATDAIIPADFDGSLGAFIYFYNNGQQQQQDFKLSPKPEKPKIKNVKFDAVELCWNDSNRSENNFTKYKVQYQPGAETKFNWTKHEVTTQYAECNNDVKRTATIGGLQPATSYFFRVCAVRHIVVSEYSETLCATTKPTSPPGKPWSTATTEDTITIAFTKPNHVGKRVEKYKIQWHKRRTDWMERNMQYTEDACLTSTIKGLQHGSSYQFRVTANCGDTEESEASPVSDPVKTALPPPQFNASKLLGLCNCVRAPEDGKPAVYSLPLSPIHGQTNGNIRKFEINLQVPKPPNRIAVQNEKVIMVVGATGSGKTTTVNAMVNHILGVQWEDDFRFHMIWENSCNQGTETTGNQAHSQTQFVSSYTLHHIEGFKVPYTLTVVDTPGFGDTRGIEHDKKITEQIRTFFNTRGSRGIDHIDAICFLTQAGNPRLTPTQKYVFDTILAMFGKDIKKNICVLFTFADGQKPQALSAIREAEILEDESNYFKFNNSALSVNNSDPNDEFDRLFWKLGVESFDNFFKSLAMMKSESLVLTKEVLNERAQLEVRVSGLSNKIRCGINTLSKLEQEKRIFNQHAADINANRNFTYTVQEETRVAIELDIGTYTTNCTICNYTCHCPCKIPKDEDKADCFAMTSEYCRECPNKCHWSNHVNDQCRYETVYEDVQKEYNEIKTRFNEAQQSKNKVEGVIKALEKEFDQSQEVVLIFVHEMQLGLMRLSEIALKPDPLQQVDYIDLLIASEEYQARPGWIERVKSLQKTRNRAEEINHMAKPGYDPWAKCRENDETRKFLEKHSAKAKPGNMRRRIANVVTRGVSKISSYLQH